MSAAGPPISESTLRRRVQFYEMRRGRHRAFQLLLPLHGGGGARAVARGRAQHRAARSWASAFRAWPPAFDYHRPLRFEDEFDVRIRIVGISNRTMRYTCALTRDGEAIATGALTIVVRRASSRTSR